MTKRMIGCRHVTGIHPRHVEGIRLPNDNPQVICLKCYKNFTNRQSFKRHGHSRNGANHALAWILAENKLYCLHCGLDVDYTFLDNKGKSIYDLFMESLSQARLKPSSPSLSKEQEINTENNASSHETSTINHAASVTNGTKTNPTSILDLKPPGLYNLGNTCFMNSALQCLAAVVEFTSQVETLDEYGPLGASLKELLQSMHDVKSDEKAGSHSARRSGKSGTRGVNPGGFFNQLGKKYEFFERNEQQDSHDFLRLLFNALDDEWEVARVKKPSWHKDCFGGEVAVRVKCSKCGTVTTKKEESLDLSLSLSTIPEESLAGSLESLTISERASSGTDLLRIIKQWRRSQVLQGEDAFACEKCIKRHEQETPLAETNGKSFYTKATCEYSFCALPQTLTIHLQRFSLPSRTFRLGNKKHNRHFSYTKDSQSLRINEYLEASLLLTSDCREDRHIDDETRYRLCAMVIHQGGSANFGHYICMVLRGKRWYRISDTSVCSINEDEVFGCKEAYMLFYCRVGEAAIDG